MSNAQSKPGPKLTEADRRAAIAKYMTCGSISITAKEFNVHRNTISKLVKSVRETPQSALNPDWRSEMRNNAIVAVNAGLACTDDAYKRGTLGKDVLKGLGEFSDEQVASIMVLLSNRPAECDAIEAALNITPSQGLSASSTTTDEGQTR